MISEKGGEGYTKIMNETWKCQLQGNVRGVLR